MPASGVEDASTRLSSATPSILLGLIGSGIQASRSPALHEREAAEQGLRCIYRIIDLETLGMGVEAVADLVAYAQRLGFDGLNVTHPGKQAVLSALDELSPEAEAVGAVNTVVFRGGRRIGHNTDAFGFAENFRRGMTRPALRRVVQVGAGGAGAAVGEALMGLGVGELVIVDLDASRAEALAARLASRHGVGRARASRDLEAALAGADGVVNTSPVGMVRYPGTPVPARLLRRELWVADIVYVPLETELLRTAREIGCRTLGGGGMAVFQAVAAFRLFTGIEPDAERMQRHFAGL